MAAQKDTLSLSHTHTHTRHIQCQWQVCVSVGVGRCVCLLVWVGVRERAVSHCCSVLQCVAVCLSGAVVCPHTNRHSRGQVCVCVGVGRCVCLLVWADEIAVMREFVSGPPRYHLAIKERMR